MAITTEFMRVAQTADGSALALPCRRADGGLGRRRDGRRDGHHAWRRQRRGVVRHRGWMGVGGAQRLEEGSRPAAVVRQCTPLSVPDPGTLRPRSAICEWNLVGAAGFEPTTTSPPALSIASAASVDVRFVRDPVLDAGRLAAVCAPLLVPASVPAALAGHSFGYRLVTAPSSSANLGAASVYADRH